jgi:hypothetical protein
LPSYLLVTDLSKLKELPNELIAIVMDSIEVDRKNPQLGGYPPDLDPVKVDEHWLFASVTGLQAISNYQRFPAGS